MTGETAMAELLELQSGVIARRQVLELGVAQPFIRRRLRRREWVTVYPGVYVNHTGPLTPAQRAWSAILDAHPAALSHSSAIDGVGTGPIHIAVSSRRTVIARPGVVVHYRSRLADCVRWGAHPPRVQLEEAVLDAIEQASDARMIARVADVVQSGKTTAERLLAALARRPRMRRRALVEGVLADVRDGTCSVLEHGYLTRVERAHGLPVPIRQAVTTAGRRGLRDLDYPEWGLVVELDGKAFHNNAIARDRDLERDLDAAVDAHRTTLRLGWGQVYDRPCSTARKVGKALTERGWSGSVTICPSCPPAP